MTLTPPNTASYRFSEKMMKLNDGEKMMRLTANAAKNEYVLSVDSLEIQLLMLALGWAVEKSEQKEGAQTKPLKALNQKLRSEYHEILGQKNDMDQDQIREVAEKYLAEKILKIGEALRWSNDLPRAKVVRYEISRSNILEEGNNWFTVGIEGNYFLESEDGSQAKQDHFLVNISVRNQNERWIATGDFD